VKSAHKAGGGVMNGQLRKSTLVDDVTQRLREMILAGEVEPGQLLPPRRELATRFGVGISTIHEAVQALAAVGLVDAHPGKGTWVRPDALETLIHPAAVETRLGELSARQLCEARAVIEVALTERAARRATAHDLRAIWDSLDAMEMALPVDDLFVKADLSFHLAVARAGHNLLLEQLYHLAHKMLAQTIANLVRLPRVKAEALVIQHSIAQAIEDHDPLRARRAAEQHMRIIEQLLDDAEQVERG
jgi:GntR family transcriptional regulator, transcriptional repressor for pyruvate dehydrogenase complex